MKGFLRKDWYILMEYGRGYLPLLLIACVVPRVLGGAYALMLAFALPRSTIANDEVRWNRLAVMLPCRTEDMVKAKYLLYGACIALGTALTAAGSQVQQAVSRTLNAREITSIYLFPMSCLDSIVYALLQGELTLLIAALAIPLYYRFTARKSAILTNILVIFFISVAGTLGFNLLYSAPTERKMLAMLLLAALVLTAARVSFGLSVRFCKKRLKGAYH